MSNASRWRVIYLAGPALAMVGVVVEQGGAGAGTVFGSDEIGGDVFDSVEIEDEGFEDVAGALWELAAKIRSLQSCAVARAASLSGT